MGGEIDIARQRIAAPSRRIVIAVAADHRTAESRGAELGDHGLGIGRRFHRKEHRIVGGQTARKIPLGTRTNGYTICDPAPALLERLGEVALEQSRVNTARVIEQSHPTRAFAPQQPLRRGGGLHIVAEAGQKKTGTNLPGQQRRGRAGGDENFFRAARFPARREGHSGIRQSDKPRHIGILCQNGPHRRRDRLRTAPRGKMNQFDLPSVDPAGLIGQRHRRARAGE